MKRSITTLSVTIVVLGFATAAFAQEGSLQRYRGRLISRDGITGGGVAYLDFQVDALSTDETVLGLAGVLANQGPGALQKAMAATEPAGWIRVANSLRYELRIIRLEEAVSCRPFS